jgi:hypothetical protein
MKISPLPKLSSKFPTELIYAGNGNSNDLTELSEAIE